MSKPKFIAIKNQSEGSAMELYFLDVIQDSYDFWSGATVSKMKEIIDQVNYYKPSSIKCVIDSVGGDAQVGLTAYNFLKNISVEVEVEIIGLAGSIASVIAMAASKGKLKIARNGFMMIHKAQAITGGTADEIRQGADVVAKYDEQIADIYSQRTGKPVKQITDLYKSGDYWMTGAEAVAQGFADDTIDEVQNISIAARLNEADLKNMPEAVRAQLMPAEDHKTFFQNQFDDMKKIFTDVINSIKGIKPADNTDKQEILNKVAEAMQPLETLEAEIENTVTNRVAEAIKGEAFTTAIANAVKPLNDEIEALKAKNTALEADIANKIGQPVSTPTNKDQDLKPIGKYEND